MVFISDTHVIGPQYECCSESDGIDNESIMKTPDRLRQVVEQLLMLEPEPEAVFMAGDVVHGAYFADSLDAYLSEENAFSVAAEILEPLPMPVYPAFGNHDYHYRCSGDGHSKSLSHELFDHFFGVEPYYAGLSQTTRNYRCRTEWRPARCVETHKPQRSPANGEYVPQKNPLQSQHVWSERFRHLKGPGQEPHFFV